MARYASVALGDEWEVRLAREEGAFTRPYCRVAAASPANVGGRSIVAELIQPMHLLCYPEAPDGGSEEALMEALRVEELLFQAFRLGVDEGRPMRVPLYDYVGSGLDDGSADHAAHEFLRVTDLSIGHVPDPDDDRLWLVFADIRVQWARLGRVPSFGTGVARGMTLDGSTS